MRWVETGWGGSGKYTKSRSETCNNVRGESSTEGTRYVAPKILVQSKFGRCGAQREIEIQRVFTEYRVQSTEYRVQSTEYRIQSTEYRVAEHK